MRKSDSGGCGVFDAVKVQKTAKHSANKDYDNNDEKH